MRKILIGLSLLLLTACQSTLQPISGSPAPGTATTFILAPTPSPAPIVVQPTLVPVPVAIPVVTGSSASPSPSAAPSPITPLNQPLSTPVSAPSIKKTIQVPLSTDLVKLLNAATANTLYVLTKGSYIANGSIQIKAANVSLNLNGSSIEFKSSPGAYTTVGVFAPHFEIYNGSIHSASGFIRSSADSTWIHDIKSTGTMGQFFFGDKGSTNATIDHSEIGETISVSVYFTQDNFTIKNSSLAHSINEYVIREEIIALPALPKNALISNVHATNHNGVKQAIGIRMGSATIENSVIDGNIRVSQATAKGLGSDVPSFIIRNTQFVSLNYNPQLSIDQGAVATIENCTFLTDSKYPNIAISGGSNSNTKVTLINNIRKLSTPGIIPKKFWGTIDHPIVTETGTVIK